MPEQVKDSCQQRIAQVVKDECIRAALSGYENASLSGLCHEGAWEAAISAIRAIDLESILNEANVTVSS